VTAVLAVLMSFARWASLDLPFCDEVSRWLGFLLVLVPVLWSSTLFTNLKFPFFVAICVILMVTWRVSHVVIDPFSGDWRLHLTMRLVWMAATCALCAKLLAKALMLPVVLDYKRRLTIASWRLELTGSYKPVIGQPAPSSDESKALIE